MPQLHIMQPRIEHISEKKLIGLHAQMSLSQDTTPALWRGLMTRRKEIITAVDNDLISMQIYDESLDFSTFTPHTIFEKWAAVEVSTFDHTPEGMVQYVLPAGEYAVFIHRGLPSDFPKTAQFIFGQWLPSSDYILDDRPHFEILGDKYKKDHPDSEEEVWIPVKTK